MGDSWGLGRTLFVTPVILRPFGKLRVTLSETERVILNPTAVG